MVYFQAVQLAGYCEAHLLNRFATPRLAPMEHLAIMTCAFLALPFGLPTNTTPPAGDAYLWLIATLAAGVSVEWAAVAARLSEARFSACRRRHDRALAGAPG
jgi:hypothetical protein